MSRMIFSYKADYKHATLAETGPVWPLNERNATFLDLVTLLAVVFIHTAS